MLQPLSESGGICGKGNTVNFSEDCVIKIGLDRKDRLLLYEEKQNQYFRSKPHHQNCEIEKKLLFPSSDEVSLN